MQTQYHNQSDKSSAKTKKVTPAPRIFIRQIAKVKQDIVQLRLQYRNATPEKKLAILRQASERKSFLKTLTDAEEFWRKAQYE